VAQDTGPGDGPHFLERTSSSSVCCWLPWVWVACRLGAKYFIPARHVHSVPSPCTVCGPSRLLLPLTQMPQVCTGLTGLCTKFWQVAIVRIGQSLGQAACNPFAAGLIAAYFPADVKATAVSGVGCACSFVWPPCGPALPSCRPCSGMLGCAWFAAFRLPQMSIYNIGIYTGFSLAQSAGTKIAHDSHGSDPWRTPYFVRLLRRRLCFLRLPSPPPLGVWGWHPGPLHVLPFVLPLSVCLFPNPVYA
jgi:MFS family permease